MIEFPRTVNRNVLYESIVNPLNGNLVPKMNESGSYIRNQNLVKFEAKIGLPIRSVPLGYLMEHAMKGDSTIDPALIAQKVSDLIIEGAEFIPIYDKLAQIRDMVEVKEEVPISSYKTFVAAKGRHGSGAKTAGGYTDSVELDCSNGKGIYRVEIAMEKYWIRQAKWGAVEDAFRGAGQALYDEVASVILTKLTTDVATAMTNTLANWTNTYAGGLATMFSYLANAQHRPACAVLTALATAPAGIETAFSNQQYSKLADLSVQPETGLFGYLMPFRLPIYYHYKQTATSATMLSAKSVVLGVFQPPTVEQFNDVLAGTEGGVLSMQFDVKDGKDARTTTNSPTANSWAVMTGTA